MSNETMVVAWVGQARATVVGQVLKSHVCQPWNIIAWDPGALQTDLFYVRSRGDAVMNPAHVRYQPDLAVSQWIRQGGRATRPMTRVMFMPYDPQDAEARKFVPQRTNEGLRAVLDGIGGNRYRWEFMINGVDACECIDVLPKAAACIGERGGRLFLGMDSRESFVDRYGGAARAMLKRAKITEFL